MLKIKNHFEAYNFIWEKSRPIVSTDDSLLFNISGGSAFHSLINSGNPYRFAASQRCLRTDSLSKIGISPRHHILFDMVGHFSLYELDEYDAKVLMIESAFDLLTKKFDLDPNRIVVTVHPEDSVTLAIWESMDVECIIDNNNTYTDKKLEITAFRTEIKYELNGRTTELWNIVFGQFQGDTIHGKKLSVIVVDSGMSLDRLLTASEACETNYENSLWSPVIDRMRGDVSAELNINRFADFSKAVVFLLSEGLHPSNKVEGYVLRKLIRESYFSSHDHLDYMKMLAISYEYWLSRKMDEKLHSVVRNEIDKFHKTVKRGFKEYTKIINKSSQDFLSESEKKFLRETHGLPSDLIDSLQKDISSFEKFIV